jgi:hypothetical protein
MEQFFPLNIGHIPSGKGTELLGLWSRFSTSRNANWRKLHSQA